MEAEKLILTTKAMSEDTWPDFEALFGKHRGARGGCWCIYYLCTSTQFNGMSRDERRDFHKGLVMEGKARGILVYEGDTPVGWCQFGPPDVLVQYSRGRAYKLLELAEEDRPQWRISCLFTDKHRRSRGIAKFTLHAAMEEIARLGGGVTEAFPFDVEGLRHNQFCGSVDMYLREGFSPVTRLGKNVLLMRRKVSTAESLD
jgi:GNAT superfamily N-acetyltransferase